MNLNDTDFVVTDVNYVIERPFASNWAVKNLCFEQNYVMAFSADGFVTYETGGTRISAGQNDVCIFPPGNVRSGIADRVHPWHFVSVNFDLTFKKGSKTGWQKVYRTNVYDYSGSDPGKTGWFYGVFNRLAG